MNQIREYNECVIVIGSYTNACSIITGLKEIAYKNKIIAFDPTVNLAKCLVEIVHPDVSLIKKKVEKLDDIAAIINENVEDSKKKIILMTSEEFIEPIRKAIADHRLQNTIAYTGSDKDNDIIFDRFKFYQFIEQLGYSNIPKTISSNNNPYLYFGDEFIIRVNRSWDGSRKLPRLKIAHCKAEKDEIEKGFLEAGLTSDMWCYQELLSTLDNHNVSVCGWYDENYHQYAVTRKIIQHPPKTGNGDVVEIYYDVSPSIITQTEVILKALKYRGPFEMEFVMDAKSGEYKIIELNPRFWMQHGLIEKVTDNSLIRRAIGQTGIKELCPGNLEHYYWLNGTQTIYRLLKGQFSLLEYMKYGFCVPSISQALRWGIYYNRYIEESNKND